MKTRSIAISSKANPGCLRITEDSKGLFFHLEGGEALFSLEELREIMDSIYTLQPPKKEA